MSRVPIHLEQSLEHLRPRPDRCGERLKWTWTRGRFHARSPIPVTGVSSEEPPRPVLKDRGVSEPPLRRKTSSLPSHLLRSLTTQSPAHLDPPTSRPPHGQRLGRRRWGQTVPFPFPHTSPLPFLPLSRRINLSYTAPESSHETSHLSGCLHTCTSVSRNPWVSWVSVYVSVPMGPCVSMCVSVCL